MQPVGQHKVPHLTTVAILACKQEVVRSLIYYFIIKTVIIFMLQLSCYATDLHKFS